MFAQLKLMLYICKRNKNRNRFRLILNKMKTKYTIVENPPYDKEAPKTFWIRKETVRFGFIKSTKIIGDYKIDNTYGELGDMPFFDKKSAKKRIKILNK